MNNDERFGLPLSLVEALREDPSSDAAMLAELLVAQEPPPRPSASRRSGHAWRAALAGLALATAVGAQSYAATVPSFEGRWTMASDQSSFREDVTGPAPDGATVIVTRDDSEGLAYELIESRDGVVVARGDYNVAFGGKPQQNVRFGAASEVAAQRDAHGDVLITAPPVRGVRAVIHIQRTGPDTAVLEHDVQTADGSMTIEKISLIRSDESAQQ
jgi:hypothetical protein